MKISSERELAKSLKDGISNMYLLFGTDMYLIEQYASLIIKKTVSSPENTFNFDKIVGKKPDLDELYTSVLTLPMMSEYRCVQLDDVEVEKLTVSDLDKLLQIIAEVGYGTVLIITIKQADFSIKKSVKCKKLYDCADKYGAACELNMRSEGELAKFVQKRFEDAKCIISPQNALFLVQRTDGSLIAAMTEADKLIAWANGGEAGKDIIEKLVTQSIEGEIFSLSKAIIAGDYARAMTILSGLICLREPAVNIINTLGTAFNDLYRAKTAASEGVDVKEIAETFGYKGREFAVKNAIRDSGKLSLKFLHSSLQVLLEADTKLKGSGIDDEILLQEAVTKIFQLLKEA